VEEHPADIQVEEVLSRKGSSKFFHEEKVIRPSLEEFALGIP
jgi:hypothetical protein